MLFELLIIAATFVVPVFLGWRFARTRKGWSRIKASLVSATPIAALLLLVGLGFFIGALSVSDTQCELDEDCALYQALALTMLVVGLASAVFGSVLAAIAHAVSARLAQKANTETFK